VNTVKSVFCVIANGRITTRRALGYLTAKHEAERINASPLAWPERRQSCRTDVSHLRARSAVTYAPTDTPELMS
jgi:hypothetical protein